METPDNAGAGAPEAGDTTAGSIDLSPVLSRVEELAGQVGEFTERFGQWEQGQQPDPEPEPDYWQQLYGEPDPEPEQPQPQQLNPDMLRQALQAELEQAVGPLQAEIAQLRNGRNLDQLMRDHPELQDPDVRRATGEKAREEADRISQAYGPEIGGLLTNSPEFIALVRKAMVADQYAAGEVPAGGETPALESAGNANPAGGEQPSIVAQVMAQRRELPKGFR